MLQSIGIIVGVVSGVAGLVLGILNYLDQRYRTRPRIRVRPHVMSLLDRDSKHVEHGVGLIEVSNIGSVPVIGSTVGFKSKRKGEKAILVFTPESINGIPWTGELKAGRLTMLRMDLKGLPEPDDLGKAFASALIGDTFVCSRRDLKVFFRELASARQSADT